MQTSDQRPATSDHSSVREVHLRKFVVVRRLAAVSSITLLASLLLAPVASASGPNSAKVGVAHPNKTTQNRTWVAAKEGYRIVSGISPSLGKLSKAHPTMLTTPLIDVSAQKSSKSQNPTPNVYPPVPGEPLSYMLNAAPYEYAAEPGNGCQSGQSCHANLPDGSQYTDDAGNWYGDYYWYTLCGPGAADVALYNWAPVPNYENSTVVDTLPNQPSTQVTWYGEDGSNTAHTLAYRTRGYIANLGFGISNVPTWGGAKGMLPESYDTTGIKGGATLQATEQMMNWEASGENSSTWSTYFYIVTWNNTVTNIGVSLHNDIVTDIANSHVGVVPEVDAGYLPNWNSSSSANHFIAIVGYDDTQDLYYYIDTCKAYTGCHSYGADTPDVHSIRQETLTSAVAAIHTNTSTGDGGWVW